MVAALFVQTAGVYFDLADVDPWDEPRDARLYPGPHPVVAHPPCARWGRFWPGSPRWGPRYQLGDDGGCFRAALEAVKSFGGVLEHPKDTHAWGAFGIAPPSPQGWQPTLCGGWTCYGHPARKPTWLYAVGPEPPPLAWGPAAHSILPREGRDITRERQVGAVQRMSKRRRASTPPAFRDYLLAYARSCSSDRAASASDLSQAAPPFSLTQASKSGGIRTLMEGAPS